MPLNTSAVGLTSAPAHRSWTRDHALLYAVGVGPVWRTAPGAAVFRTTGPDGLTVIDAGRFAYAASGEVGR